jgi:hypothetical protein
MNDASRTVLTLVLGLALLGPPGPAAAADAASRTFDAPIDRVWAVTEAALKSLGWDVDRADRAVGWMLTDSRGVDFKQYAVYGTGVRHKLRIVFKAAGAERTTVRVEREVYAEERILWMAERTPVPAPDQVVEQAVLDAIQRAL